MLVGRLPQCWSVHTSVWNRNFKRRELTTSSKHSDNVRVLLSGMFALVLAMLLAKTYIMYITHKLVWVIIDHQQVGELAFRLFTLLFAAHLEFHIGFKALHFGSDLRHEKFINSCNVSAIRGKKGVRIWFWWQIGTQWFFSLILSANTNKCFHSYRFFQVKNPPCSSWLFSYTLKLAEVIFLNLKIELNQCSLQGGPLVFRGMEGQGPPWFIPASSASNE